VIVVSSFAAIMVGVIIVVIFVGAVAHSGNRACAMQANAADIAIVAAIVIRPGRVISGKGQDAAVFAGLDK
jgi:hypothetical protein